MAGVAPKITLDYNSNSGNGMLGQGWRIGGLSTITRCGSSIADDGFNRAVQFDSKDNFCMDGQRLIHHSGNEFRTQIESYSKIEYTGSRSNPSKFTVWLKSGDIYEYAKSEVTNSNININWLVTKISDRYGNDINFNYTRNVGNTLGEDGPFLLQYSLSNYRIDEITYASNSIKFNYDKSRKDYSLFYQKGQLRNIQTTLNSITIKRKQEEVISYYLKYNTQSNSIDRLKIESIKTCIKNECTKPLKFAWNETSTDVSFSSTYNFPNINVSKDSIKFLDLNNDGFTDIYEIKEKSADVVWINNQKGSFRNSFQVKIKAAKDKYKFLDLNNDGFIDVYASNKSNSYTSFGYTGGGFSLPRIDKLINIRKKNYLVDLNNDTYADLVRIGPFTRPFASISSNTSDGNFNEKNRINTLPLTPWLNSWKGKGASVAAFNVGSIFTDVNQDGKIDLLFNANYRINNGRYHYRSSGYVFINNGNGFTYSHVIDYGSKFSNRLFEDINADGILDIIDGTTGYVYLSTDKSKWERKSLGFASDVKNFKIVDFNQDGNLDILYVKNGKGNVYINNGKGTFLLNNSLNLNVEAKALKFGDLNANGFIDSN